VKRENIGVIMSEINDGGPAFPVDPEAHSRSDAECRVLSGMSLRDYFAGQAIIGLVGHGNNVESDKYDPTATIADVVAGHAYFIADAMLKARQK
jgi:hypothetical protein